MFVTDWQKPIPLRLILEYIATDACPLQRLYKIGYDIVNLILYVSLQLYNTRNINANILRHVFIC